MTVEELQHLDLHSRRLGQYLFDRVGELLRQGVPADALKSVLISYYDWLGDMGRDEDQDAVADVMDSLVGHCSPGARLTV